MQRLMVFLRKRPFALAGMAGVVSLLLAVFLAWPLRRVAFEVPAPFRDVVIAIEWASSPQTMEVVLGTDSGRAARIEALLEATNRDSLFVLAYTLFMCVFAVTTAVHARRRHYFLLTIPALLAGLADFGENSAIRTLLLLYDAETFEPGGADYVRVRIFARVKWALIALYFAGAVPYLWSRGWWLGRMMALAGGAVVLLWVLAQFSHSWAEPFALTVFALLSAATAFCFRPVRGSEAPLASP